MEEVLYLKFSPQNNFYTLTDCSLKFLPKPKFPFKIISSHWPASVASSHLGEPPNGLKQQKMGSQWEFSQAFPLMMIKVSQPFYPNKSQTKPNINLATWESIALSFSLKTSH